MRLPIAALLLFLGSFPAIAQLPVNGILRLGDTTQQHILHMRDGSQLIGRIIRFDEARLGFVFRQQDTLQLSISEIDHIDVPDTATPPVAGPSPYLFQYSGTTRDGAPIGGEMVQANRTGFRLRQDDGRRLFFYWKNTDTLYHAGPPLPADAANHQVLTTDRGDRFTGILQHYDGQSLRFLLRTGNPLRFVPQDIGQLNYADDPDAAPNRSDPGEMPEQVRMYVSPTGFLLDKKRMEFRTILLSNTFDYGISDHFTLGGGFSTVFIASMFQTRAKFGGSIGERIHLAGGVQLLGLTGVGLESSGAGLAYGSVSLGTREKFLNIMVGRGTSFEDGTGINGYSLSGSFRIANRFRLFGEYLDIYDEFRDGFRSVVLGSSWFRNGNQIDFGFWISTFQDLGDGFIPFPVAAYSYRF